jgi:hypothetical protein
MSTNEKEITKEQIFKAMQCKTAEELQAYAKTQGYDITLEEAHAYMAELADIELDGVKLKNVAGGGKVCYADGCALRMPGN